MELPRQHRLQPGQYFAKVIFTFKKKPTIECNYAYEMREEGCSSTHATIPVEQEKDRDAEIHDLAFPELGDKPNHPKSFLFTKRKFGDKKLTYGSFQSSWFEKWPWLTYNETDDKAFCFGRYNRKECGIVH